MNSILINKWTKAAVFLICLAPLGLLVWEALTGGLGSNPTQFLEHATGDWTLRFVAITLSITPLRKILHRPQLVRFRRMLGLFAFFYGCCHFSVYAVRTEHDVIFQEDLTNLQKRLPRFRSVIVASRPGTE